MGDQRGAIRTSFAGEVATVLLDRPDARNALSIAMCNEIVEALESVDRTDSRVIVFGGAGSAFSAGADFAAVTADPAAFLDAFETMLEAVARHRLPTIAAIHGPAVGGGFQLATVCDFRLASRDATLGIPSPRLGIVVNLENVERLVVLAGVATAKELLMTGRTIAATEAHRLGLVNEVFDRAGFERGVDDYAARLAALAPLSVQGAKRTIQTLVDQMASARQRDPTAAGEIDRLVRDAYLSDDLKEGLRALWDKDAPRFRGA